MSDGLIGYHPDRIASLRARTAATLDDLRQIHSHDPAAADALDAIGLARQRLAVDWLPLLDHIAASTAMTAPINAMRTTPMSNRDDDIGPPSSLDIAAELNLQAGTPETAGPYGDVVLSNGWSWTCGPVSATTGQPASGCEFMPPSLWDFSAVVLAASVLPITGELIDTYDCAMGDIPCEAVLLLVVSGRAGNAIDDLLGAASRAIPPPRPVDDILMPNGTPLGRAGSKPEYREVRGDLADAEATFIELSRGGQLVRADPDHLLVQLPNGGFVGLRTRMSERSADTAATIDTNIAGYENVRRIKFNP